MISDGISGVMFTNDPVSLHPDMVVINLIKGCGEELVGGHQTPTQIVCNKNDLTSYRILAKVHRTYFIFHTLFLG